MKAANDWIQTKVFQCQKQLVSQLCHTTALSQFQIR